MEIVWRQKLAHSAGAAKYMDAEIGGTGVLIK
jgi:hypothetical protein